MSSQTTTTTDDSTDTPEATDTVAAQGNIRREDWDMIGRMIDSLADETRVRADSDGLHVACVDSANVAMLDLHVMPDQWTCDQAGMIGINVDEGIQKPMKVLKSMDSSSMDLTIADGKMQYGHVVADTIDPDSIRRRPDLPDIEYATRATVPLIDLKEWIDAISDYETVAIRQDGLDITFACDDEHTSVSKTFEAVCETAGNVETIMSTDYLYGLTNSMLKGHAKQFHAVLSWDDEYPLRIGFDRIDHKSETDIVGQYVQAPRVDGDN